MVHDIELVFPAAEHYYILPLSSKLTDRHVQRLLRLDSVIAKHLLYEGICCLVMVAFVSEPLAVDGFPIKLDLEQNDLRGVVSDEVLHILEHLLEWYRLVVVRAPDCLVLHTYTKIKRSHTARQLLINVCFLTLRIEDVIDLSLIPERGRVVRPRHCQLPKFLVVVLLHPIVAGLDVLRVL